MLALLPETLDLLAVFFDVCLDCIRLVNSHSVGAWTVSKNGDARARTVELQAQTALRSPL